MTKLSEATRQPLPDFDTIQWPLDRVGAKQRTLQVPSAYGTGSRIARGFSATIEKKYRKLSDQAFRLLLIHGMWRGPRANELR